MFPMFADELTRQATLGLIAQTALSLDDIGKLFNQSSEADALSVSANK